VTILLVGLNAHGANIPVRERMALSGEAQAAAYDRLHDMTVYETCAGLREAVIVSTCNRTELYAVVEDADTGWQMLVGLLAELSDLTPAVLEPELYRYEDASAVRHLMRVAAGLDSLVLGEPQILGQVLQSMEDAQAAGACGPLLAHLFSQALHAGKRARSETDISRGSISVSHVAALLTRERLGDLSAARLLVVGAGEMARLAATALRDNGATSFSVINRTHRRAQALAEQFGARALHWSALGEALAWADAVISATGAPHRVIGRGHVEPILCRRAGRPLLFVDIAMPGDVDRAVEALPGVELVGLDALHTTLDNTRSQREAAVPHVELIVSEETRQVLDWLNARAVLPTIVGLRRWAEGLAASEVEQALSRLGPVDAHAEKVVRQMASRLVNKLLHPPTTHLKRSATGDQGALYAEVVNVLFELEREHGGPLERTLPLPELALVEQN